MTSPEKPKFPAKDCGEEIRELDFVKVIDATREYGNLSQSGELLLQTARGYLRRETEYMWKNAKIAVLGQDLQIVLVSGYQSFQLVVTHDDDDAVNTFCEEKGWKRVGKTTDDVTSAVIWGDIKGTLTDRVLNMLVKLIKKAPSPKPVIEANGIKRVHVNGLRARKPANGTDHTDSVDHFERKVSPKQNAGKVEKKSSKCVILVSVLTVGVVLLLTAFLLFYVLWLKPNNFTIKL